VENDPAPKARPTLWFGALFLVPIRRLLPISFAAASLCFSFSIFSPVNASISPLSHPHHRLLLMSVSLGFCSPGGFQTCSGRSPTGGRCLCVRCGRVGYTSPLASVSSVLTSRPSWLTIQGISTVTYRS